MIRKPVLAASALLLAVPVATAAQSAQEKLDERYNLALAAGYKALFLCSAIAHAEANGTSRSPESVLALELTGIQAPLNDLVQELSYEVKRHDNGTVERVNVAWAPGMPPRSALHLDRERGCGLNPMAGPSEFYGRPANPPAGRARAMAPMALEPRELVDIFEGAFENGYGDGARTTAVLVQRNGGILGERYIEGFDPATPQRTWSVAKSLAATIVGAAVHRGDADINASAGLGYSRGDPRRAITLDHLLRMASGRYSDTAGNRTDPIYWGGASVRERALQWPLIAEPGSTYRYANNDTLAAIQAIMPSLKDHPPAQLFAKLGMTHTVAEIDWRGQYILSSQAWTTARDLAKLGQLHLQDGVWEGERVLAEGWVEYVSTPSGPQPEGRNWGYGAGWWLFNQSDGIPADTFFAAGIRGQYVVVVPSRDVVIVRRGEDPVGKRFDIEAFTRDVLAGLDE